MKYTLITAFVVAIIAQVQVSEAKPMINKVHWYGLPGKMKDVPWYVGEDQDVIVCWAK